MVRKTFNITNELDEMLKEAQKILDCTEASIIKNALLLYLKQITKN
jgi:hypothetical protein